MKKTSKVQPPKAQQQEAVVAMEKTLSTVLDAIGFRPELPALGWSRIEVKFDIPNTVNLELVLQRDCGSGSDIDAASTCGHTARSPFTTMTVEDLDLAPHAKAGAQSLVDAFGTLIKFTSGRRSIADQCRVMARNIVNTNDRKWIEKTYANSGARKKLQDWVDANATATTEAQLKTGLEGVMNALSSAELNAISYHFAGAAFDLVPVGGTDGDKIKKAIPLLPHYRKWKDGESGVDVWHVEFNE